MANLDLTIGLNMQELEKGLANAGKSLGRLSGSVQAGKNPFQGAADKLSTGMGIGSLLGGPIGGVVGAFFDAFGGMINAMIGKVKELAQYAQEIRLSSLSTGLGIGEIRQLEAIGQAFGISLQTMTKSVVEFTRRMGEARIKGGEVTNILAKMGVGLDEIEKGTFDATKAMKMLADAHAAGTDEATLLYYGTKLFGDSFKELLPLIKAGSQAVQEASSTYIKANDAATTALGRFWTDAQDIGRSILNVGIMLIGHFSQMVEEMQFSVKNFFSAGAWNPFESLEDEVTRKLKNAPRHMTAEERAKFVLEEIDDDKKEAAKKEIERQQKGKGTKLSPFGMAEAGAASQMQQMGGGDIFGAVAFTPLERIATATEATAEHTRPRDVPAPRAPDEPLR